MRARGVETFRRAEDESRGTVGKVRCVLCLCSRGARDWEVETWEGVARWWREVRWIWIRLMVRFGGKGGRSNEEDVMEVELEDAANYIVKKVVVGKWERASQLGYGNAS